jgi:hypothetical protein
MIWRDKDVLKSDACHFLQRKFTSQPIKRSSITTQSLALRVESRLNVKIREKVERE